LAPGQPVAALLAFERALLPGAPACDEQLPAPLQHAKALIETVRATADELTVGRLRWPEYGEALFWHLLNALRLRGLTAAQREYALLAAGVWAAWLDGS
jgi:hypothetical protein